jgi:hypothetical protein
MFYGAISANLRDPFGHTWVLLSWEHDLGAGEIERRAKDYFASEAEDDGVTVGHPLREDTEYQPPHWLEQTRESTRGRRGSSGAVICLAVAGFCAFVRMCRCRSSGREDHPRRCLSKR